VSVIKAGQLKTSLKGGKHVKFNLRDIYIKIVSNKENYN